MRNPTLIPEGDVMGKIKKGCGAEGLNGSDRGDEKKYTS